MKEELEKVGSGCQKAMKEIDHCGSRGELRVCTMLNERGTLQQVKRVRMSIRWQDAPPRTKPQQGYDVQETVKQYSHLPGRDCKRIRQHCHLHDDKMMMIGRVEKTGLGYWV